MSDPNTAEKKRGDDWKGFWIFLFFYVGVPLLIVGIAAFVGFVKFMAWWRIAFGECSP